MDLDLWDCFGRKKLRLITEEIRYLKFHLKRLFQSKRNVITVKPLYKGILHEIALLFKVSILYNSKSSLTSKPFGINVVVEQGPLYSKCVGQTLI